MSKETEQKGYKEGFSDGVAGKDRYTGLNPLDAFNDKNQDDYEEGFRKGYHDGKDIAEHKK